MDLPTRHHSAQAERKSLFTSNALLYACLFALLVWIIDPIVDSYIIGFHSFREQLFSPDLHEIYMRSVISILFVVLGVITARNEHKVHRWASELSRSRGILANTTDRMAMVDSEFRHVAVNAAYLEPYGRSEAEVVGQPLACMFGDALFENEIRPRAEQCMREGIIIKFKTWTTLQGADVCLGFMLYPWAENAHQVVGFILSIKDLTEREAARRAMQQQEAYSRMLVENAPVCIHEISREGRLTSINPAGLKMFCTDNADALVGKHCMDVVVESQRQMVSDLLEQAWQGESVYFQYQSHERLGERYFDSCFIPIRDESGEVVRMMGVTQNQTDRVKSEQALRNSEAHLRFLFEHNPSMYITLSAKGRIRAVNHYAASTLGYSPDELIGEPVEKMLEPEEHDTHKEWVGRCLKQPGTVFEWETAKRHKDGHAIIVRESGCAVKAPNDEINLLLVCRDITERYLAQQQLATSESRYRGLIEDTPALICMFKPDGEIQFVNHAYSEFFQKQPEELIGHNFLTFLPQHEQERIMRNINKLTPEHPVQSHEHRVIAPGQRIGWQRSTIRALFDAMGRVVSYQSVGEDVTAQKEAQTILLRRTNLLQANQKILFQLAREEFDDEKVAYQKIVQVVPQQLEDCRINIWMFDDDFSQFECLATSDASQPADQVPCVITRSDYPRYFSALEQNPYLQVDDVLTADETSELVESYLKPLGVLSMLDMPIRVEGQVVGVVCFESLCPRHWSAEDVDFAKSIVDLCAVVQSSAERKKLESIVDAIHDMTAPTTDQQFFNQLTRSLGETLTVRYAFIGTLIDHDTIETISVWGNGDWQDNFTYALADTPCMNVVEQRSCTYPRQVTALFPKDQMLKEMGIESYIGTPLRDAEGKTLGLVVILHDQPMNKSQMMQNVLEVFAQRASSELARQVSMSELRKLSRAVESSATAVLMTDETGRIEYVNPEFSVMTGYSKDEVLGQDIALVKHPEITGLDHVAMYQSVFETGEWKGEFENQKKDGTRFRERLVISAVRNHQSEITHLIYMQEDTTREHALSEELNYQASHDMLTGLMNRVEFERRVQNVLKSMANAEAGHALCFLDLDQFKVVNDTCGHAAGDELLRQIVPAFSSRVRKQDIVARLGGDEFAILMLDCTLEQARRAAENIQQAIQEFQFGWEDHVFRIGVSIGMVAITDTSQQLTELFKQADAACYMAKDLGRNRIHTYQQDDQALMQRHGEMQWVGRIYKAFEDNRFQLYAQPIEPMGPEGKHVPRKRHYELLIRMQSESGELIPPGAFLPAAERYQLIGKLDEWVIRTTLDKLTESPAFLNSIDLVSINLSGQSVASDEMLKKILDVLKQHPDVDPAKLCFEITETAAIANLQLANRFIAALKKLGCRFSLDDFGSGLSSFGYLKSLDVDYLKIDGMFVRNIAADEIDRAMVKSINEIGQVMGLQTIAEFVENDEIKGMLREIGVNYAQGYGIGRPQPFDQILSQADNVRYLNHGSKRIDPPVPH